MSLCLFAGILFGLHLTNIITLKLPTMQNETGDNQLASGFLDDSQSEE